MIDKIDDGGGDESRTGYDSESVGVPQAAQTRFLKIWK